jgi:hypothetical protein
MRAFVNHHEMEQLLLNLAHTRGERGFSQEEAEKVGTWAKLGRVHNTMIGMAINQQAALDVREDGEVVLIHPDKLKKVA